MLSVDEVSSSSPTTPGPCCDGMLEQEAGVEGKDG